MGEGKLRPVTAGVMGEAEAMSKVLPKPSERKGCGDGIARRLYIERTNDDLLA
jgi:hypothetical protein